ncbi:YopX family protein [Lactiplantibacillus plantarum]
MIKFRAWDKGNEIYLYNVQDAYDTLSGFVKYDDGEDAEYDECCFGNFLDNKRYDIEQFTGLTDVNCKEIYEGDIVHGYDQEPDRDDGYIGSSMTDVVNFKYGAFWIGDSWYKVMVMTPPIVEVIGNVHENAELLEEDK